MRRAHIPTRCKAAKCVVAAVAIACCSVAAPALAETQPLRRNAVVVEGLGRTIFYHVSYERTVGERISLGIGISHRRLSSARINETETLLPIYTSLYFQLWGQRFFATQGFNLGVFTNNAQGKTVASIDIGAAMGVGYEHRWQNGLLLRATGYVLIGGTILPWFGATVGYAW
jgi:hypothetical protein